MKNSKLISSLPLIATVLILQSCYEYEPAPTPSFLRAEKLIYSFASAKSYRTLEYDAGGRLSTIIVGLTDPESGTHETRYKLSYTRHLLRSMESDDETVVSYEYTYGSSDEITETNTYLGNDLQESHKFTYDILGRLIKHITWIRNPEKGTLQQNYQVEYQYDSHDNLIEERRFSYNGSAFQLLSTTAYLNFDDKKSPEHLFITNLQHPMVQFFQNNPQMLKLTNANGTSAEQKFTYEYNSRGLSIKKGVVGQEVNFEYQFELVK